MEINCPVETRDFIEGHRLSELNFRRHVSLFRCFICDELERLTSVLLL
jgi:hypothetical protein